MITREQFEAHVRAEASKRYDMRWNEYLHLQNAYVAARMENEWPLVEALQDITTEVQGADVSIQRTHDQDPTRYAVVDLDDWNRILALLRLSPYTTKPIEP